MAATSVLGLCVATVSVVGTTGAAQGSAPPDPTAAATSALARDASGDLTERRDGDVLDFVGVPAGVGVDNPGVSASTGVREAARSHLDRYGAALGTAQTGSTFVLASEADTSVGNVVRFQQEVDGLPVVAGEVVVALRDDRELDSILAETSTATKTKPAVVGEAVARENAQASFQKEAGAGKPASVESKGRWVLDGAIIGASADVPVRTVYRFELTRGAHERRLVFVDDQTGVVLMNNDLIGHAKRRIVCDNNQVSQNPNVVAAACTNASANKVRGEGDPAAALAEANTAYDLGGVVHDGFAAFGIADLTELIGRDIGGGVKALSQTVRWCYTGQSCPYANAFWNGSGMYYGTGYAVADDVVGHEMGHGVTERTSNLVYWGQSGAINESLSDIFGEIIDHRNVGPGDSPTDWNLGEDLPIPALRNIQDPTSKGDPDRTGSPLYVREVCSSTCYPDQDGVHSNSGVGNKTFYLASQGTGGTPFNGVTIPAGIDAGDPNLTKSGRLWLLADQLLTSGSDYADLGVVLGQACTQLQTAAVVTAADCTIVGQAATATQLAVTPTNNPQPADAPDTCPVGTTKQVLFDSETGTPATKFTAGAGWSRNGTANWGQIAHSAPDAWSNQGTPSTSVRTLSVAAPIAVPAGQATYLHFHQWRVLEYTNSTFYDGGQVAINGAAPTGTWINGPAQTMAAGGPIGGQLAFGGDSRGYTASRLDLSSYAGTSVTPSFTLYSDSIQIYLGWWLDDISVYTCAPGVVNTAPVVNAGPDTAATVGVPWSSSGSFTDDAPAGATATVDYGDGTGVQPLTLTGTTFNLSHTYATPGAKTVTVTVTDAGAGNLSGSDTATVTVAPAPPANTAPVVDAGLNTTATAGVPWTSSGSFTDDAPAGATATVDYGDGGGAQPLALSGTSFTLSHTYTTPAVRTVTVTVTDVGALSGSDTATVTVAAAPPANTAPVVYAGPGGTVTAGSAFISSGSFTDNAPAGATATVNYGDGSGTVPLALSGTTFSLNHVYSTPGTRTITVTVTDAGALSGSGTATVTVNAAPPANTAPVVDAGLDRTTTVGSSFTSGGSFTDNAPAGATATVDYGNGSGPQALPLNGTSFSLSATYTTPGAKTVTVRVTDAGGLTGADSMTVTVTPSGTSQPPPQPSVRPGSASLTGQAVVGKKLTAVTGGWVPSDVTFTYAWLRNGKVIAGAVGVRYRLTGKDRGKRIQVVVTGSRPGYRPAVVTSAKSGKVRKPD